MHLRINRYSIDIIPDDNPSDERDEAFIESVLGLKKSGDSIELKRVNAIGLSRLGYLRASRKIEKEGE